MKNHLRRAAVASWVVVAALALASCGDNSDGAEDSPDDDASAAPAQEPSMTFKGPNGESPVSVDELSLTDEEVAEVQAGSYKAAFVWHEDSPFTQAIEEGVRQQFDELGIEVVATTSAEFDPAKQANNVQTVLALDPDVIVTIAADPTAAAAAFQPAVDAGVKIAVLSTPPAGYTSGKEIVGIVTGDLTAYGKLNAEILGEAVGGEGKVGYIFHDADFWVTNQRDQAFKDWMAYLYPDIEIVAEEGFSDPARTEDIANAMLTQNPELDGVYVAWATAAEGALSAARNQGRTDLKIVTNDLEANLATDMVSDGNVVGIVANASISAGRSLGIVSAYGLLGKQAPEMAIVEPLAATKDNVAEVWLEDYGTDAPDVVTGG